MDTKDDEIGYLRDIIHKLNSELSRCQSNTKLDKLVDKTDDASDNHAGRPT